MTMTKFEVSPRTSLATLSTVRVPFRQSATVLTEAYCAVPAPPT